MAVLSVNLHNFIQRYTFCKGIIQQAMVEIGLPAYPCGSCPTLVIPPVYLTTHTHIHIMVMPFMQRCKCPRTRKFNLYNTCERSFSDEC